MWPSTIHQPQSTGIQIRNDGNGVEATTRNKAMTRKTAIKASTNSATRDTHNGRTSNTGNTDGVASVEERDMWIREVCFLLTSFRSFTSNNVQVMRDTAKNEAKKPQKLPKADVRNSNDRAGAWSKTCDFCAERRTISFPRLP
jgi:hypothetical protein